MMKAVVFDGPYQVSVQERPVPKLQDDNDIIVKVQATALCGSELHVYRGHQPSQPGCVMGHEFTGIVTEAGSAVKNVRVGDRVVTPFTVSCGQCFFCEKGCTSRCEKSLLFGSPALDGGQAEYVRVPLANGTVMKAPETISDRALILMADIFPTGFYGVKSALELASPSDIEQSTMVVIGCGPVGLCAIVSALHRRPRHLFAIDSVDSRLALAEKLGAEPLNFQTDAEGMKARIREVTNGRGADMAVEVVGLAPALRTAFDLVRPFGIISSIGVHNSELPWTATEGYNKNLRLQMGRCPVRHVFAEALALLEQKQHLFESAMPCSVPSIDMTELTFATCCSFMFDKTMPLSEAPEGYKLFEQRMVQKVIFSP